VADSASPPLIGITTYGQDEKNHFTLPREYVDSVRRAGALPILLAPGEPNIESVFAMLDGLILSGGGDLGPSLYGGEPHETVYMVDEERDNAELEFARMALDSGLPTLAICRGIQVINVVLGGTLIEHLPEVVGDEIPHRLPPREPTPHPVKLVETSRLAEILQATEFSAASWHHQALCRVAGPLDVVAHAPDGTIEAVEMPDHPWLIGVQWHPELTAAEDPIQQQLFNEFIQAVIKLRSAP
jgi:putative glutamine amidotransferase